jgi:hypothetical protein
LTNVQLLLPDEVTSRLSLANPDSRDVDLVILAIEGLTVAASIVTLATLRPQLGELAAALRGWVIRRPVATPTRLIVKGRGLDHRVELSPNVSRGEIIAALQPLLERDDDEASPG